MSDYMPDVMKRYKNMLEFISNEDAVGMNPTAALSDKELDRFQQMPATKQKIASPDQQTTLDRESMNRDMDEEIADEGNEFSGAREDAIDAGKKDFEVGGEKYHVTDESLTHNQFEEPTGHVSHAKPDWSKAGTTAENPSKAKQKSWDSYMSNESEEDLGTTSDDYSKAEQHDWDEKGSNESMEWDDIVREARDDLQKNWNKIDESVSPKIKQKSTGQNAAIARIRQLSGLK